MPIAVIADKSLAKALWLQGLSASAIAKQLGTKRDTVQHWVHRYGWVRDVGTDRPSPKDAQLAVAKDVATRINSMAVEQSERLMAVIRDNKVQTLNDSKTAASALAVSYATARKALGLDDHNGTQQHLHVHMMRGSSARVASPSDLAVLDAQVVTDDTAASPAASAAPTTGA